MSDEKDSDLSQDCHEDESSLHSKLESLSLEEKSKLAVVAIVVPEGPARIDVFGGVVSPSARTVQLRLAGEASVLPAASVALTAKACGPIVSELYSFDELQLPQGPESSLHSKLESLSLEEKPKLTLVEVVVKGGPEKMVVLGAARSAGSLVGVTAIAVATARRIPIGLGILPRSRGLEPAKTSAPSPSPSPSVS